MSNEVLLVRKVWLAMKDRCDNPKNKDYKNYGGRGITYEAAWKKFDQFLRDMGMRPTTKHTLDRQKNNEGYSKNNCRWATRTTQTHNSRLRKDNTSGLKGVTWDNTNNRWFVRYVHEGIYTFLYQGPDKFEACCARKSYEARYGYRS